MRKKTLLNASIVLVGLLVSILAISFCKPQKAYADGKFINNGSQINYDDSENVISGTVQNHAYICEHSFYENGVCQHRNAKKLHMSLS